MVVKKSQTLQIIAEHSDTVNVSDAEKIYNQKCSNCHGGDLRGGVGPDLTKIGGTLSQEDIEQVIANGQGAMPKGLIEGTEATAVAGMAGKKRNKKISSNLKNIFS